MSEISGQTGISSRHRSMICPSNGRPPPAHPFCPRCQMSGAQVSDGSVTGSVGLRQRWRLVLSSDLVPDSEAG